MLIEPRSIQTLDREHRRQLGSAAGRRAVGARRTVRAAAAATLMAVAHRLAPEAVQPGVLRTRAAPN